MNSIIIEARNLYNKTLIDPDYTKSQIWNNESGNYQDLMRIINFCETPQEVLEELRLTDMYAIRIHDKPTFDLMMAWYKIKFPRAHNPLCLNPNLWKMNLYCRKIYQHCGKIESIVELGGGNGQFAFMAKHLLANKLHIDIDIPESLYMAYVCTRHRFPNAKCYWIQLDEPIPADQDFIFCPVGLEKRLENLPFDLFVNTASMGELPNDKIRYWMDFVQNKITVKYFYGFNRFLNTINPNESLGFSAGRKTENEASVLFDNSWQVMKWEVEPLMAQCPYEDPKIARYLEIILKRTDRRTELEYDLSYMKMEDWWRYREIDSLGTHRSNQLVNDYTMRGTLFFLWDAIRLDQLEAVPMILQYFKHIGRSDLAFEEEFYYKKLLK